MGILVRVKLVCADQVNSVHQIKIASEIGPVLEKLALHLNEFRYMQTYTRWNAEVHVRAYTMNKIIPRSMCIIRVAPSLSGEKTATSSSSLSPLSASCRFLQSLHKHPSEHLLPFFLQLQRPVAHPVLHLHPLVSACTRC